MSMSPPQPAERAPSPSVMRWVCDCQEPPVLLATYGDDGVVNIKSRDRYWHVRGTIETVCPKCGRLHLLDSAQPPQ